MRSNDAFRKILEQARAAPEKKAPVATPAASGVEGAGKKRSQGSEKYRRLLEQKAKQKEREDEESKYRDRASERRNEKGADGAIGGAEEAGAEAMASVDIEMSKYLGGDVQHTHLVRGTQRGPRPSCCLRGGLPRAI